MPKKTPAKKSKPAAPKKDTYPFSTVNNTLDKFYAVKNLRYSKKFYLAVVVVGLLLLVFYKKSWFIAAMVNGTPITNWELQSRLNAQYRTQTLTQMINEKVITDEARKTNNLPTPAEIDQKITELENQVGGSDALNSLLGQQGQTRDSLRQQIMLEIMITKLYGNEATVSAQEVDQFIQQNGSTLQATDSAGQRTEATNLLKQQKLTQIFNQKFQDLKTKADIKIF